MATPYDLVIESFLPMITDYDLSNYTDNEKDLIFEKLMKSACVRFDKVCKKDLFNRNEGKREFNEDLSEEEIYILNIGMKYEWLSPKVFHTENLETFINTRDFNIFSPANKLKESRETLESTKKEFHQLIMDYSYKHSDASDVSL